MGNKHPALHSIPVHYQSPCSFKVVKLTCTVRFFPETKRQLAFD